MKSLIALASVMGSVLAITLSSQAPAAALASLYNGEQFRLKNQLLLQDSDRPDEFYYLPQKYRVKRRGKLNEETQKVEYRTDLNHRVVRKGEREYSVYSMLVELEQPSPFDVLMAQTELSTKLGRQVVIKGLVPICGISLGEVGSASAGIAKPVEAISPDATLVQYSLNSSEAGKCNSPLASTEFRILYRVPLKEEPVYAENATSSVGLVLAPVELTLPYKYKDQVVIQIDARSAYEQLKAAADVKGTYKFVSGEMKAAVSKLFNMLQITGGIDVNCQNPDKAICDRFLVQAQEILAKTFFTYLPFAANGDTNPLTFADKDKAVDTSLVKVQMAMDQQSAERIGKFKIDFTNTVYSSITAQVQVTAARLPVENLAPEVRALLK